MTQPGDPTVFLSSEDQALLDELKFVQEIMAKAESTYGSWENWFILAENILVFASIQIITSPTMWGPSILIGLLGLFLSIQFLLIQRGNHIYAVARFGRWQEIEALLNRQLKEREGEYMAIISRQKEEIARNKWYRPPLTTWSIRKSVPVVFMGFWIILILTVAFGNITI